MTRIVADALRERGYLHASITPRAEIEHDPERATLVFTIDPGRADTNRHGRGRWGRRPSAPKFSIASG